ncbi:MAG: NAD-dependent epimerase/dehydratase family protein, partial [Lapillicoccus sp.]
VAGEVREVRMLAPGRGRIDGVAWRVTDTSGPGVLADLAGVDALVWVAQPTDLSAALGLRAADRRTALLLTARALLVSAAAAGVRQMVVVTSAEVYGARADNPVPLPDDAPLAAVLDDGLVGDLLAVEALVEQSRANHPDVRFTMLRPAVLVGAGIDTTLTRYFEAPRLLAVKGGTPLWQFCHVDDLASAAAALVSPADGPAAIANATATATATATAVTVGCDDALTLREVERLAGMRRIEVGETTAVATATQLHRVGVLPSPASDLAYVMYPWTVGSVTLRARGWHPAYDNETCLGVLLEAVAGRRAVGGRRIERRDAALGAASAAVALAATAAVLRRARRP